MKSFTREQLIRDAIARTLFPPTTLPRAIDRLAFVQADPIRAPARAQDLILRHRVTHYRVGDLERRYADLDLEEDYLVNYGFLPRQHVALMHPRTSRRAWTTAHRTRAAAIIDFIRERKEVHPQDVEEHFAHGRVRNAWGGMSRASTQLLDLMHYRGLLRIARRDNGVRVYALPRSEPVDLTPADRASKLLHLALSLYGPVPERSLGTLTSFLRVGAPQLRPELRANLTRLKRELPQHTLDGVTWYWPEGAEPVTNAPGNETVRLLAPFDPLVWDRRRFELLWGWAYRFEAYTPVHKRVRGYYALPLLWRDEVLGWANVTEAGPSFGYLSGRAPKDRAFARELEAELNRLEIFLRK
ncbi:MAG: crosslink repair DNA glycosylase YcaQ family protein [Archangium sp.]|nr:crosslink repair DNA glycosylase YcaQ family protein [Archangium sp.]